MLARLAICVLLALAVTTVFGEEPIEKAVETPTDDAAEPVGEGGDKLISGMSIVSAVT